ncbi:pectate lyase C [Mycena filopes]|nr:pectate lyase C [Mycena filopes]
MFTQFVFLAVASSLATVQANPTNATRTLTRRTATNVWPSVPTTSSLSKAMTIAAGTTFTPPLPYTRFDRGSGACKGQSEGGDADAVFLLAEGATLSRVTIGANQAEGVHCLGSCTLDHVYFEDVCEDAITIKQTSASAVSRINFGGVSNADDKIVQHNGAGTVIINSFYAENFGKVYRSCGNCGTQFARHVQINDLWAVNGDVVAGINTNFKDTATIRTTQVDDVDDICVKYTGNSNGDEPVEIGSGSDSTSCLYSSSDIKEL